MTVEPPRRLHTSHLSGGGVFSLVQKAKRRQMAFVSVTMGVVLKTLVTQAWMLQPKNWSIVTPLLPMQKQEHHHQLNVSAAAPRRRLQNNPISVNFANVYPEDYAVCFNYGPELYNLNMWAGPVRYGEWALVILDGDDYSDNLYTDVYSVSSSSSVCNSRTPLDPSTWYDTLSERHVNIWFWAVDSDSPSGAGATHNFLHWEPDVDLEVFLNMAVGYSSCTFQSERHDGRRLPETTELEYSYQSLKTGGISCDEYHLISKIHVDCDGTTASIDINIDDICPDVTHAFVAYGRKYDSSYPLSIMLLQGTSCSRVQSCYEVLQDNMQTDDAGHSGNGGGDKSNSKKSGNTTMIVIGIILGIIFLTIVIMCVIIALKTIASNTAAMTNVPTVPPSADAVAVELHPANITFDDKLNQVRPLASSRR